MIYARLCAVLATVSLLTPAAFAGIAGQPPVSADTLEKMRAAVEQFEIPGGDVNKARPDLGLLVETDPTQDFTGVIAPAIRDDGLYRSLLFTLSDALDTTPKGDAKRAFLQYNIARLHLLRARAFDLSSARAPFLSAADKVVALLPTTLRDPAVDELRGDLAAEHGDVTGAAFSYRRIRAAGGNAAYGQYKIGEAYLRTRRYSEAETAYLDAVKAYASAATPDAQLRTDIYQGLASVYVQQNRAKPAIDALNEAVKGKDGTIYVRTDLPRRLLTLGYAKEIADWAQNALRRSPGDDALESLLLDAQKKAK